MTNIAHHNRFAVQFFATIDSTNRYLLDEAAAGAAEGRVAVADHQSHGRGRRGRVWDAKPGSSLLFSILFRPPPGVTLARYGQTVALAVIDACAVVGGFTAGLKWPNDVLAGDRKLAGVLAEAATVGDQTALVVGCGLNLNWSGTLPTALGGAIGGDEAAGHALDRDEMLYAVLDACEQRLAHPNWVLDAYRSRCLTLGQRVRIEQVDSAVEGTAVDIADDGALVVEVAGKNLRFTVGDVVHLRAA